MKVEDDPVLNLCVSQNTSGAMDIAPTPSTISPGSVIAKKRDESGVEGPGPLWNPLTQKGVRQIGGVFVSATSCHQKNTKFFLRKVQTVLNISCNLH